MHCRIAVRYQLRYTLHTVRQMYRVIGADTELVFVLVGLEKVQAPRARNTISVPCGLELGRHRRRVHSFGTTEMGESYAASGLGYLPLPLFVPALLVLPVLLVLPSDAGAEFLMISFCDLERQGRPTLPPNLSPFRPKYFRYAVDSTLNFPSTFVHSSFLALDALRTVFFRR